MLQEKLNAHKEISNYICENICSLLHEYINAYLLEVDAIPKINEDHYQHFLLQDVPCEKGTVKEIVADILGNSQAFNTLFQMGLKKIVPEIVLTEKENTVYLKNHGYIIPVKLDMEYEKGNYLTLSSKGWACYTREEVIRVLRKEKGILTVPSGLEFTIKNWNEVSLSGSVLLYQYFHAQKVTDYLVYNFEKNSDLMVGCEISGSEKIKYIVAWPFIDEDIKLQISALRRMSSCEDVSKITIVSHVKWKNTLDGWLSKDTYLKNKTNYFIVEEHADE